MKKANGPQSRSNESLSLFAEGTINGSSANGAAKPKASRRKKHVVLYHGEQLELFAIGECGADTDKRWRAADKYIICEDRQRRFFVVTVRQQLFTERPLRVQVSRIGQRAGARMAQFASPLTNGGFERRAA